MRLIVKRAMAVAIVLTVWSLYNSGATYAASCSGNRCTVQRGDTLSAIAAQSGTTWQAVWNVNRGQIRDPNRIYPGQTFIIPTGTRAPVQAAPTGGGVVGVVFGFSPNHYPYGWCTWGAAHLAHDNVDGLGDAWHWIYAAQARGLPTGSVPVAGATAIFQAGVQGSSVWGHVAHVVAVGPGGTFEVEGMAAPFWGQYSYSWVHSGWGVSFIY